MVFLAQVMTWGYKMVTPRRVVIARDIRKKGPHPLKYHRADRLHVVAIAAGTTHSTVVTEDGLIFYWVSSDPHLRLHQVKLYLESRSLVEVCSPLPFDFLSSFEYCLFLFSLLTCQGLQAGDSVAFPVDNLRCNGYICLLISLI